MGPLPSNPFSLIVPASPSDAIDMFLAMARVDAADLNDKEPTIRAQNYSAPEGRPYRVRFDLRDPDPASGQEGDQDHVLFKAVGDTHNRTHKGQRRPEDFQPDRAARIFFIPQTLQHPDYVYRQRDDRTKVVYVAQAGPDEWFVVVLHELDGSPRFNFCTAFSRTQAEHNYKRTTWERLFPKPKRPPKPPKKRQ